MAQKTVTGKAVSDAKETKVSEVKEEVIIRNEHFLLYV